MQLMNEREFYLWKVKINDAERWNGETGGIRWAGIVEIGIKINVRFNTKCDAFVWFYSHPKEYKSSGDTFESHFDYIIILS